VGKEVREGIKLVICREDLPKNPRWVEQGYPYASCWDIDEFFSSATKAGPNTTLYSEARRIFWEAYWRLLGRYKRGRPFFEVYEIRKGEMRPIVEKEEWVLRNIILAAFSHDLVPPEAKRQTYKLYRELFGSPTK